MSDQVGNHIVGFPTRRLKYLTSSACFYMCYRPAAKLITMRTAYVRKIFRSVRIRNQTCAYHVHSKNQRYANSFRLYAYSDENTFTIVTK